MPTTTGVVLRRMASLRSATSTGSGRLWVSLYASISRRIMQGLRRRLRTSPKAVLQPCMIVITTCLILPNSACLMQSLASLSASFVACHPKRTSSIDQQLHLEDSLARRTESPMAIFSTAEPYGSKFFLPPSTSRSLQRGVQNT